MQQSLLDGLEITIVSGSDVLSAWQWICTYMSPRPDTPSGVCIYDAKLWHHLREPVPLEPDDSIAQTLAVLYLASQLADLKDILLMAWGENAPEIKKPVGPLDEDVKNVINSKVQFRNGLSEHLAFWIQLANTAKASHGIKFAGDRPNRQPTDKGPDGLFIEVGAEHKVVVLSVKNSVNNPANMISSARFRTQKSNPDKKKQIDAFWLQIYSNLGIERLDDKLSRVCDLLQLSANQRIRMGLLQECSFNAVVVADNSYASVTLFEAYRHIPREARRRVATYIGSTGWEAVAEKTRKYVMNTLKQNGVW